MGVSTRADVERLLAAAGELADRCGDPHARGVTALAEGLCLYFVGRFRESVARLDEAAAILRTRCTGAVWELDTAHIYTFWCRMHMGAYGELAARAPALQREALERGNRYAAANLAKILDASTGSGGNPALLGTPHYMSPEQCRCETPDARSDLYAAGAVFFALLTGRPPYHDAGGVSEVMLAQCSAPPPDPRSLRPDLPEAAAALIAKAMAKERPARHQSAEALADDLRRLAAGSPIDVPGGPDWPALEALSADLGSAVRRRDPAALEAALERLCAAARPRPADADADAADAADADAGADWSPAE
jgi:hypothetical protein